MRERLSFEHEIGLLVSPGLPAEWRERETAEGLRKKLRFLSFLPHWTEQAGRDVELKPSVIDPGIYDGPVKYRVAEDLQKCLMGVMRRREFAHIKVALVDLTKDLTKPEFAGYYHKSQVFVASVAKIAAMLGAFQLRHDLRVATKQKKPKTLAEVFAAVRDDWAQTQRDGKAQPFTRGISLRGKLVALAGGGRVVLVEPKAPRLENVFASVAPGGAVTIEFSSTGEDRAKLSTLIKEYNRARYVFSTARKNRATALSESEKATQSGVSARVTAAKNKLADADRKLASAQRKYLEERGKIDALGFWERMGIAIGGDVPASNFATSTIVRDVGFPYIASTLLQSGLYDTNRNGGLWLGADYYGRSWRGALAGGSAQSATPGSLAALMTLLERRGLVGPQASRDMHSVMMKRPTLTFPGTGSWFVQGLSPLPLKIALAKVGLAGGADDLAYIERDVEVQLSDGSKKKTTLRYVAVALRARNGDELSNLIRELDKCILANNGLTPAQGGHA
jgi:hypothetical protein